LIKQTPIHADIFSIFINKKKIDTNDNATIAMKGMLGVILSTFY